MNDIFIRPARDADAFAVWAVLEPILRSGETYALPRSWSRDEALDFWFSEGHSVFVAVAAQSICGTYYLHANQQGGGAHVANCGYATAPAMTGKGVATAMCLHSLEEASKRGFLAMQFNLVVSTNEVAVSLWRKLGFAIVGTIPRAFDHPIHGLVDALVMHRDLKPK